MTQRIGIVGGGQLARMMHAASIGLGLRISLLAEGPDTSAAQVVADVTVGDYTDPATVLAFARGCEAVTFDHEHVPTAILRELEATGVAVRPGPDALVHAQDKAVMRRRLAELDVPCPAWRVVATPDELAAFADEVGWPVIAKTSRGGYDGKGVWKVTGPGDAQAPFDALAGPLGPTERQGAAPIVDGGEVVILAEEFVPFVRELSVLVVRRPGVRPSPTRSARPSSATGSATRPRPRRLGWTPSGPRRSTDSAGGSPRNWTWWASSPSS